MLNVEEVKKMKELTDQCLVDNPFGADVQGIKDKLSECNFSYVDYYLKMQAQKKLLDNLYADILLSPEDKIQICLDHIASIKLNPKYNKKNDRILQEDILLVNKLYGYEGLIEEFNRCLNVVIDKKKTIKELEGLLSEALSDTK